MCGIVAYLGDKEAQPLLLEGLRRLEYRGYDSSGMAVLNGKGLEIMKKVGRIAQLEAGLSSHPLHGTLGICHTRWATHGKPTNLNAHPHTDATGKLAIVHNGVIENYGALKKKLSEKGYTFKTETDTEVLAVLIGFHFDTLDAGTENRLEMAVMESLREINGTYGMVAIHQDQPGVMVGARRGSPLVLGIGAHEHFLASDVSAVAAHTQTVAHLRDFDVVTIDRTGYRLKSLSHNKTGLEISTIDYQKGADELGDFPHYMLKEIFEQVQSVQNAVRGRLNFEESTAQLGGLNLSPQDLRDIDRVLITGCGTAMHAGMVGEYIIESLAHIPVEVDYASEFRLRNSPLDRRTLVLAVSQSGETEDTLGALREARRKGHRVLGICNNVASTLARETDGGVYMYAGPEVSVAATKSFTSQVVICLLMGLLFGRMRYLSATEGKEIIDAIEALPDQITAILKQSDKIRAVTEKYHKAQSMLFFGRQMNYGVALEGALKLKEISYIHAEGHPTAELKHGVIALVDEETPSVFIAPRDGVYDKNINNVQQIKARKGPVIAVATEGDEDIQSLADDVFYIPAAPEYVTPILAVVPLQLFAYHMAVLLGRDVDKPRNLAKSVTVP
ncbi:MAG TPA: glutamine--fructose-6-phosphate transaminase (isomerizing) [Candidatus Methylacidiphilales bacterium]|jgi:glucosamine--fructose-6-phosphate aminotransferase (isomerizing)|nr:glutamine--fructose-6-phosphate transaminase (isomerizing) [Candidatus Methylacidiphilales bacterium]